MCACQEGLYSMFFFVFFKEALAVETSKTWTLFSVFSRTNPSVYTLVFYTAHLRVRTER